MVKKNFNKTKNSKQAGSKESTSIHSGGYGFKWNLIFITTSVLLGILIYSNTFKASFHYDDLMNIVNNWAIKDLTRFFHGINLSPFGRPVTMLSFALNFHYNQLNVWGYHVVNLSIHLINSLLIFYLVKNIFATPAMSNHKLNSKKIAISWFVALLFLAHPLATSTVVYIVQRSASLACLFYLYSVLLYMKARINAFPNIRVLLWAGSVLAGILALFTKENAFSLPLMIIMIEITLFNFNLKNLFRKPLYISLLGIFALVFISILYRYSNVFFATINPWMGHSYKLTPWTYLLTQFFVVLKYFKLYLIPINLNIDYDIIISNNLFNPITFLSFVGILLIFLLGIWSFHKHRLISFGIFWIFIGLLIESSIFPIADVIFEHRTYLSSFGFVMIMAYLPFEFINDNGEKFRLILLSLIVAIYSVLTFERNKVWENDVSLWRDAVTKSPRKPRPYSNLGLAYLSEGNYNEAKICYANAIKLDANYKAAWFDLGVIYEHFGKLDSAKISYLQVLRIDSAFLGAYNNLASISLEMGNPLETINFATNAIKLNPNFAEAYYNRGTAYLHTHQLDLSLSDLNTAINLKPDWPKALSSRSIVFGSMGKNQKALADITEAIRINPGDPRYYFNRAITYGNMGKYEKALADYNKAIELKPDYRDAINNRNVLKQKKAQK